MKRLTEEHKRKIGESRIGKTHTEATKKKIAQAKYKPVIQFSRTGKFISFFYSMLDAQTKTGISRTLIYRSCVNKHGIQLAGGYIWKYRSAYTDKQLVLIANETLNEINGLNLIERKR
jgi:hypothetical protein